VIHRILIGSRASALALAQTNEVIAAIREIAPQLDCQVVPIRTVGDKAHELGQNTPEGKNVFTKEIEDSLLKGEIQIAIHSMKDLTTNIPTELIIAAVPTRADYRDALISRGREKFGELQGRARVGTRSPRRRTQLLAARNDLQVTDMHGNVDTRLRKLDAGNCDAIVLAAAGLKRLGLERRVTEYLSIKTMIPAIGQGALAIEVKRDDLEVLKLISRLDDRSTHHAVDAERAFASKMGANCRTPIAAYARIKNRELTIEGMVASADGRMLLRSQLASDDSNPQKVGEELAESLLRKGAQEVLEAT